MAVAIDCEGRLQTIVVWANLRQGTLIGYSPDKLLRVATLHATPLGVLMDDSSIPPLATLRCTHLELALVTQHPVVAGFVVFFHRERRLIKRLTD